MSNNKTVYIVDDDVAIRDSLSAFLSSVGLTVKTFDTAEAFLNNYINDDVGCLVLDVRMSPMSGLELQQTLLSRKNMIPIIFLTAHGDLSMAVRAMREGAFDFFEKPFDEQRLLDRINQALRLSQSRQQEVYIKQSIQEKLKQLTAREREIVDRIITGQANKVIALELGLSERTVELHRARSYEKLGAKSLAELVRMLLAVE